MIPYTSPTLRHVALVMLAVTALAGCAVTPPEAHDAKALARLADIDHTAMFKNQEPVTGPISLDEAIARAVKYNLQQRLALMERALEDNLLEVQQQGMLPKLTARAGLRTRSNDYGSSSQSLATGQQSLVPSTSQERTSETADLQMSWNVLDFGLSYFGAKAQGNKALAAEERRRRVLADIIRETRAAYWNAVTAERLKDRVTDTLKQARQTLDYARQTEQKRLVAPIVALRYQRDLLNMVRQTETLENELAQAKAKLSALMNLPPATTFALAMPDVDRQVAPPMAFELAELEALAMVRRPELREEAYQARNAVLETRMSLLRLLPNANLFGGLNYDTNRYLVNKNWADAGMQVSWNLLNVLSWPAIERSGEAREKVAELRRQALRMTVLTQVHVAWLERERAEGAFARSQELMRVQDAIQKQTENAARSNAETQLELVRARVESLLATRANDVGYAALINAQNTVLQAAGVDPMPDRVDDDSVAGLAQAIAATHRQIEKGRIDVPRLAMSTPTRTPKTSPQGVALKADPATAQAAQPVPQPAALVAALPPLPALRATSGRAWDHLGSLGSQAADGNSLRTSVTPPAAIAAPATSFPVTP